MSTQHEIPTHLDVQDRVLFGLTVRQFLYMLVGSSAAYALYDQQASLPLLVRAVCVGITLITTLAFVLVRPGARSLEAWLVALLLFAATPRSSTWRPREPLASDWRPGGGHWQELAPSLAWAAEDAQ